jgi:hypothetical protein
MNVFQEIDQQNMEAYCVIKPVYTKGAAMSGLETYKNHELLNVASELMRQEFAIYELDGGEYDDAVAKLMAKKIINACMPQIMDYLNERVVVEASKAHLIETKPAEPSVLDTPDATDVRPFDGLHVEAKFKHVEFQPVILNEHIEGFNGSLIIQDYDLFAVVQPQYFDAEPDEIVFGDAVMVPFGDVTRFDLSERQAA